MGITDTRAQLWADALRTVGIDDIALAERCADDYTRYRADVLELSPGALACIEALRARGCKLGIVTNGFAATHHEKIARLGLTPHFDALFIADEMGMVKPDPAIFRHACEVLGSTPERTAMVGDRYDRDITGAKEAGLVHRPHRRPCNSDSGRGAAARSGRRHDRRRAAGAAACRHRGGNPERTEQRRIAKGPVEE